MNRTPGTSLDPPDPAPAVGVPTVSEAEAGSSPRPDVACARCDHDLRGEVLAWAGACPLEGICPECGLTFHWAELLAENRRLPRWSVEARAPLPAFLRRIPPQTAMAVLRPRRMLRELRMEHRPRPWRLAACLLPWLVVILLVPAIRSGAAARRGGATPAGAIRSAVLLFGSQTGVRMQPAGPSFPGTTWTYAPNIGGPSPWYQGPLINEGSIARARERWPERTIPVPAAEFAAFKPAGDPAGPRVGPVPFLRTDGRVVGVLTAADGTITAATAAGADRPMLRPVFIDPPIWVTVGWLRTLAFAGGPVASLPLVGAAVLALLPVVRRRARVRWRHVVRLTLLAAIPALAAAIVVAFVATQTGVGLRGWFAPVGPITRGEASIARLVFTLGGSLAGLWIPAYLWMVWAARHHLRLDRPRAVAAAVATVAALAPLTVIFMVLTA